MLDLITPDWPAPPTVRAVFTTRSGGVSAPPYDSLNLGAGIGDSSQAVTENRRRLHEALQLPAEPVWLEQVHGTRVVNLDQDEGNLRADAVVARSEGAVCAIRVADCMPVLFASRDGAVIGAAHAGWRGLSGGVLESTVAAMGVAPSTLMAWMGPAISARCFEVGEDVWNAFVNRDPSAATAFVPNPRGRWQCDLYALARDRLARLGIEQVFGGGWCTFTQQDRFFSFRRDGPCGRMAALVWKVRRTHC